jgi:hypothetical protein
MSAFVFLRMKGVEISLGIQYSSMKNNKGINSEHRLELNRNKICPYFCYFSSLEKRKGTIFVNASAKLIYEFYQILLKYVYIEKNKQLL